MARYISRQVMFQQQGLFNKPTFRLIKKIISSSRYLNNRELIDKETWKIGSDCYKIEKLIKYYMHVQ